MSISFEIPETGYLDLSDIAPHRIEQALEFQDNRTKTLEGVRDQFQANLQVYMAKEDVQWKAIFDRMPKLSYPMIELEKNIKAAIEANQTATLQVKKEKLSEEIALINTTLDKFTKKKQDDESEQRNLDQQKAQLIEAINLKILQQYEQPSATNKSGILYNWIMGCLYGTKVNVHEFCTLNNLQINKPIPKMVLQKPQGFSICGTKKPISIPEVLQLFDDSYYAWQAVKVFIFQNNGADLLKRLKEFNPLNIKPFQQMLTEELIYEKKNILAQVFEIDVKDQVRIFIELIESFLHIQQNQKSTSGNSSEKIEIKLAFAHLKQKQQEEQTIKKQIEMVEKRKSSIKALSEITTKIIHYIGNKQPEINDKQENNDKENANIASAIQTLEQQITQEEYALQAEQKLAQEKLQEERAKELQRQADADHKKLLKEQEEIEKQSKQISSSQQKQQQNEVGQSKNKVDLNEDLAIEEQEESNHDHDNDFQGSDYDDDDEDGEDKKQLMEPEKDPLRYNIQKTMFPHLLNTNQNKQQQKKTGGALFSKALGKK